MIFETRARAKWVLAGEHTVLRGGTAVALLHPEFRLTLKFTSGETFQVSPLEAEAPLHEILEAIREVSPKFVLPQGRIEIGGNIPMGSGMGSSAALCVAVTRWLAPSLSLESDQFFKFATELEHRFHGKSSGMDVAVILAERPILFSMSDGARPLQFEKIPRFTFHDTGLRAKTSDCVRKVQSLRQSAPQTAADSDQKMSRASLRAYEGLTQYQTQPQRGLELLAEAMNDAQSCFEDWGLVPNEVRDIIKDLKSQGALGAKLTGAGAGGFVVALWGSADLN